jgi:hypothetical protein
MKIKGVVLAEQGEEVCMTARRKVSGGRMLREWASREEREAKGESGGVSEFDSEAARWARAGSRCIAGQHVQVQCRTTRSGREGQHEQEQQQHDSLWGGAVRNKQRTCSLSHDLPGAQSTTFPEDHGAAVEVQKRLKKRTNEGLVDQEHEVKRISKMPM